MRKQYKEEDKDFMILLLNKTFKIKTLDEYYAQRFDMMMFLQGYYGNGITLTEAIGIINGVLDSFLE